MHRLGNAQVLAEIFGIIKRNRGVDVVSQAAGGPKLLNFRHQIGQKCKHKAVDAKRHDNHNSYDVLPKAKSFGSVCKEEEVVEWCEM